MIPVSVTKDLQALAYQHYSQELDVACAKLQGETQRLTNLRAKYALFVQDREDFYRSHAPAWECSRGRYSVIVT